MQEKKSKKSKVHKVESKKVKVGAGEYSIVKGRSMCPSCHHDLSAADLVPVLSWLLLRGKCRYCHKAISAQYPLVELTTALLFLASYLWWPYPFTSIAKVSMFVIWLVLLVGFMALTVYDLRWMLLPNRLMLPLSGLASVYALINILSSPKPLHTLISTILAVAVGGGIFYVLFLLSDGKWIGGGDVKLGWLLGLVLVTPAKSVMMIFLAALLGSVLSLTLMASGRVKRSDKIPFGPFLILAAVITVLFGTYVIDWYSRTLFVVG